MADLSVTTINKFIRESYDESERPKSVARKGQMAFLEEVKVQFECDERLKCQINTQWDFEKQKSIIVPELHVSFESVNDLRWRSDHASFYIGFRDRKNWLEIWTNSWRTREPKVIRPLSSPEEIQRLIARIDERFKLNRLKSRKKGATEGFKIQALKAQLNKMAEELEFDFAVENKHRHVQIYIRKDEAEPLYIKFPKGKNAEVETTDLRKYVEHTLAHLAFSKIILDPKLTQYQIQSMDWTNYS